MEITSHFEPVTGSWTHLLADPVQHKAAIIDPVLVFDPVSGQCSTAAIDPVLALASETGYDIDWVLETHIHADHLSAARYICQQTGAQLAISQHVCRVQEKFARVFNLNGFICDGHQFDRLLVEGDELPLGELVIRVLETPGHTPDSITFLTEDAAFVGDTLFAPAQGSARCDFPGGSAAQMYSSVQKLYALPPHTRLFLCHDYPAAGEAGISHIRVQDSIDQNIHIRPETGLENYVALRQARDATLSLPRLILPSVQFNIHGKQSPAVESNGVAYLKTPLNRSIRDILAAPQ